MVSNVIDIGRLAQLSPCQGTTLTQSSDLYARPQRVSVILPFQNQRLNYNVPPQSVDYPNWVLWLHYWSKGKHQETHSLDGSSRVRDSHVLRVSFEPCRHYTERKYSILPSIILMEL